MPCTSDQLLTRPCSNTTENLADSAQVRELHTDIQKIQSQLQQLILSQPGHPIQQYIEASGASSKARSVAEDAATLVPEAAEEAALSQDLESIKLFDGFSDWIDSLSTENGTPEISATDPNPDNNAALNTDDSLLTKDTRVHFCVKNVKDGSLEKPEVVELPVTGCIQEAIDILEKKGTVPRMKRVVSD